MYIVKFYGCIAFIKPWSAVRDNKTSSLQFLTPSTIEGIEKKLFPELLHTPGIQKIRRYKLNFIGRTTMQEKVQSKALTIKKKDGYMTRMTSVINRTVLLEPSLFLAFDSLDDAQTASTQHICLTRNEDLMRASPEILEMDEKDFGGLPGFELRFEKTESSFMVGFNRYDNDNPMYGYLEYQP